jgi:ABC-type proline/glycine betaine transport system permease subunit
MLLPWRTVVIALVLLFPFVPVLIGLGTIAGATMVALFVFTWALPFTVSTVLECWHPAPPVIRLVAGARTLAVTSVVVATITPLVTGSGGAGVFIQAGWELTDYPLVLRGFAIVVLLSLIIDVILGTLQWGLSRTRRRFKQSKAPSVNHAIPMPRNE